MYSEGRAPLAKAGLLLGKGRAGLLWEGAGPLYEATAQLSEATAHLLCEAGLLLYR